MARILVIDDEAGIRTMVVKFLATGGHEILEAADGAAAMKLLEASAHVDLVITDLYMPGMDGIEFTRRLRQVPSRPAIIAMSGGGLGSQVDVLDIAGHLGAVTLAKPFTGERLLAAVRQVLGQGNAA
jgi:CheY-like chemotaxis protein